MTEYPDYRSFVTEAFGNDELVWRDNSPVNLLDTTLIRKKCRIELIYSQQDELLSEKQTELMCQAVIRYCVPFGSMLVKQVVTGSHDDVFKSKQLVDIVQTVLAVTKPVA